MPTDRLAAFLRTWRRPEMLLLLMAGAAPLSFATWQALLDNFAIHRVAFTGREIGILQSLREVPGFLAFAVVLLLWVFREQRLAYLSLAVLGAGTAITGLFPSVLGLYCTTVLMSLGFHYYYTVQTSLTLQWLPRARAPEFLGRMVAAGSVAAILAFVLVWVAFDLAGLDFAWVYAIGGGLTLAVAALGRFAFPLFPERVQQRKHMVLRTRYWLYYALIFMSGARRQIFVVFAGFLLVERFGFGVADITLLFLLNATANVFLAPLVGRLIARFGERRALVFEYLGLVVVFTSYALVEDGRVAAALYLVDHLFFALAIAIDTYFQKIADPSDIAGTAGVSFSINHVAAVTLPVLLGVLWLASPALVFLCGSGMAVVSLLLALNVPADPRPGNETVLGPRFEPAPATR